MTCHRISCWYRYSYKYSCRYSVPTGLTITGSQLVACQHPDCSMLLLLLLLQDLGVTPSPSLWTSLFSSQAVHWGKREGWIGLQILFGCENLAHPLLQSDLWFELLQTTACVAESGRGECALTGLNLFEATTNAPRSSVFHSPTGSPCFIQHCMARPNAAL